MTEVIPCKRCGNTDTPDTTCGYCGGPGLVHGYEGDPMTCPRCGCSGMEWPPRCPKCSAFRAMPKLTFLEAADG